MKMTFGFDARSEAQEVVEDIFSSKELNKLTTPHPSPNNNSAASFETT